MKKNIFVVMIVLLLFVTSVSAISKYYSPIVTGQDITNELSTGSVYENLILGTPDVTAHRTTFNTCIFGAGDYRYMNVDEDGLIYLTDDDTITIFNNDCVLITTHNINGTLMSQPFIFDVEGEGFQNIFYISTVGTVSQVNEYELVNGVIISPIPNQFPLNPASPDRDCYGLYCDRDFPFTSGTCATFCSNGANIHFWSLFDVQPLGSNAVEINTGITHECPIQLYDEVNDLIQFECGANDRDFHDRTFPAIYGMDMDSDGNIEVVSIYPTSDTASKLSFSSVDLVSKTLDSELENLLSFVGGSPADVDVYSSGGFSQVANIGSLNSNGEMFVSFSMTPIHDTKKAVIFNSVGSVIKTVLLAGENVDKKISNFAVADIDRDLKNDYCITYNNTRLGNSATINKTVLECYSGATNNIMTNCTINGWGSDNTITLSLLEWDTISPRLNAVTTFGIFDLQTNNGGECTNVRPDGFTGLTSASEGALVPVDVSGDSKPDLIYYGADGARLFKTGNIAGQGTQSRLLCGAEHIIFCDDFNYDFGLVQRGWQVLERDGEINTSITPIDDRLNSTVVKFQSFVHEVGGVSVNYTVPVAFPSIDDERILTVTSGRIVFSFIHPVVSHSYKLNLVNANGLIEFRVDDLRLKPSIQLRFRGGNVSYVNSSDAETLIATEFLTPNVTHTIKVTQFFGKDTETEQGFSYPFNLSVERSFYRVFIDNELIADNILFADNRSADFSTWIFTKNKNTITGFTMDDIFSYRGTSQIIDNSNQFFTSLQVDFRCQIEGNSCGSTSQCCPDLTCFNNVCTGVTDVTIDNPDDNALRDIIAPFAEATNISLGTWWIMIMFVIGIFVFIGVNLVVKDSIVFAFVVFLVLEFLLLIVGTALGMLSAGIIISIVVVALVVVGIIVMKWVMGIGNNG